MNITKMLLVEQKFNGITSITEGVKGDKNLFIEGIFMQADIKNKNGRIYPQHILSEAVRKYNSEFIQTNRALGELNHPDSPTVNPERACIKITELKEIGSDIVGKARVLVGTPMGDIVKGLLENDVQLGVSSRAMGAIKSKNGANVVQPGLLLSAVDVVYNPSAHKAMVNALMEDEKWLWEANQISEEILSYYKKVLLKTSLNKLPATEKAVMEAILTSIG